MTPLELDDLHHSSVRVLQNRDYIDNIKGSKEKEDLKEKIKEPWASLIKIKDRESFLMVTIKPSM